MAGNDAFMAGDIGRNSPSVNSGGQFGWSIRMVNSDGQFGWSIRDGQIAQPPRLPPSIRRLTFAAHAFAAAMA
jgi:hypothetical protein